MKYLKLFQLESEYNSYKNGSDYILPNVSYIKETEGVSFEPCVPAPQKAGDIVYYVNGGLKTVSYNDWKTDLGTPVGVITIPSGFAPDGKARMVALSGQTSQLWCPYSAQTDTSLTNYIKVPTTDNAGSTSSGSNSYGCLPSDKFTSATSYVDSVAKYFVTASNLIPSPYSGDAPNPEYYKEISGNNALSDFSGLENTKTLVELDSANYQAANYCWTYSDGVSTTQWYLPACGELGYMIARFNDIQAGLAAVSAVQLGSSIYYWSSSECSSGNAYYVRTRDGDVMYNSKEISSYYARPWACIN